MNKNLLQFVASGSLLYALTITAYCPCGKLNKCHYYSFFGSIGFATAIVLLNNAGII
jgi:hypothetical protein